MNKKRQTSYLLLLLSIIAITGGLSFDHALGILQEAGPVSKAVASTASNHSSITGLSSFLPPALTKSIINQVRNTNATSFVLHNALNATTSALHKTAGTNATSAAADMNKTAGTNATSAAAGMNKTAGTNAISAAAGMNKTAGTNATSAAAGMNKTAGTNAISAAAGRINSTLNLVKNTNATKFAANSIINATKNSTHLPSGNATAVPP